MFTALLILYFTVTVPLAVFIISVATGKAALSKAEAVTIAGLWPVIVALFFGWWVGDVFAGGLNWIGNRLEKIQAAL